MLVTIIKEEYSKEREEEIKKEIEELEELQRVAKEKELKNELH